MSTAFQIEDKVVIKLDHELAIALGRLILATDTDNTALLAVGHQLRSLGNAKKIELPPPTTKECR